MLKFDDQFPLHRKVAALSDGAFRLHVEAIFWARRNLMDGFVPTGDLATVSARFARADRFAAECVQRGVWHRVQDGRVGCDECTARHNGALGDGFVIHGYADWQDTRSKVLHNRDVRAAAGRTGGIKSGESRRKPEAEPKQVAKAVLAKQRTPSPSPPYGGLGGARARDAPRRANPHPFTVGDDPQTCAECGLPQANRAHPESP